MPIYVMSSDQVTGAETPWGPLNSKLLLFVGGGGRQPSDGTVVVDPANGGGTVVNGWVTEGDSDSLNTVITRRPNSTDWGGGGTWTVEIEIDAGDADITCQVKCVRTRSNGGTPLQEGSYTATQVMDQSRTFSPVSPTWTSETCLHRLGVECLWTNNGAHGGHSVTVGVGTSANEVTTTVNEGSFDCRGGGFQTKFVAKIQSIVRGYNY